jgi:hypothetical protein
VPLSKQDTDHIRHAYLQGVKRGRLDVGYLENQLQGAVGFSIGHVDKYSADQTAWAVRRLQSERPGQLVMPTAENFARYFPHGPEDGEATDVGNIFVAVGLSNLVSLWLGLAASGTNGRPLSGTGSVCGVGTGTTNPGTADVALTGNTTGAYYQAFDSLLSLATTSTNGQLVGTSTFGSAVANFAWNEWCWATGAGAITAGSTLNAGVGSPFATASTAALVNHKAPVSLGTKASGSSWVFSTTFTIS